MFLNPDVLADADLLGSEPNSRLVLRPKLLIGSRPRLVEHDDAGVSTVACGVDWVLGGAGVSSG